MSVKQRQEEMLDYLENNIDMVVSERVDILVDDLIDGMDYRNPLYQQALDAIREKVFVYEQLEVKYLHALKKLRENI